MFFCHDTITSYGTNLNFPGCVKVPYKEIVFKHPFMASQLTLNIYTFSSLGCLDIISVLKAGSRYVRRPWLAMAPGMLEGYG